MGQSLMPSRYLQPKFFTVTNLHLWYIRPQEGNRKNSGFGKHQDNYRGSGGKESDNFQQVMNLISFPPVEDNLVSTELSPVKGVNSVLTGFALLELLVALSLLSVSLLALAKMQAEGIRSVQSSYYRSQATILAQDMAERMFANQAGVLAGGYSSISTIGNNPDCISNTCSAIEMANYDAWEWLTLVQQTLPTASGKVTSSDNQTFIISLSWQDPVGESTFAFTVQPVQ